MTAPLDRTSLKAVLAAYDDLSRECALLKTERDDYEMDLSAANEALSSAMADAEAAAERDALLSAAVAFLDGDPGAPEALRRAVEIADPTYRQPVRSVWTGLPTP